MSYELLVTSSHKRVTSSNRRVTWLKAGVAKLKAQVRRLNYRFLSAISSFNTTSLFFWESTVCFSLCLILISSKCSCKVSLFESVIGAKSRNETVVCQPFLCRICTYDEYIESVEYIHIQLILLHPLGDHMSQMSYKKNRSCVRKPCW